MGGITTVTETKQRLRWDDDDEVNASWMFALNTGGRVRVSKKFRVRIELAASAGGSGANTNPQLQYNKNAAGWVNVTPTSSVIRGVPSNYVPDDTFCTEQMAGSQVFKVAPSQGVVSWDGLGSQFAGFGPSNDTECEYVLEIVPVDVVDGDLINLRITDAGTPILYTVVITGDALITVDKPSRGAGWVPVVLAS